MVDVHAVVDDGDGDSRPLGDRVGRLDVGWRLTATLLTVVASGAMLAKSAAAPRWINSGGNTHLGRRNNASAMSTRDCPVSSGAMAK